MYLYYDKTRTLKTALAHGEPIRQNSDINIFVCLDRDYFNNDDELAKKSQIACSITFENGEFGADGVSSDIPQLLPFKKINSSEITYYLQNNKQYWTYHLKLEAYQATMYPGKIYFNTNLIVDGKSYAFGTAELFVEARIGLPSVDNSITQTQYDNMVMRLNKLTNRMTILEQTGGGSGSNSNKITDLTGSKWKFNEKIDFQNLLDSSQEYYFYIDFTSDEVGFNEIILKDYTSIRGYKILNYFSNLDGILACYYDEDGDGVPGWESTFGDFRTIDIDNGQDVKNTVLIDWLYANATLISSGSSSGSDLILDDYYDKTQADEIFATKQELLDQINKILGENNIETLDSIKELANAIGNNPDFYKEILELINQKQESGDFTALVGRVETLENNLEQSEGRINRLELDVPSISLSLKTLQSDFDNVEIADVTDIDNMFKQNN